jgi:RecA-family ATPase
LILLKNGGIGQAKLSQKNYQNRGEQAIVICGSPGSAKSFLCTDLLRQFVYNNEKVAFLALEEDRKYHQRRAWALHRNSFDYCDLDVIENDVDRFRREAIEDRAFLKDIGDCIEAPKRVTYKQAIAWIENKAKKGYEAIFIDPITKLVKEGVSQFEADEYFMGEVDRILTQYKTRIFIVTHPKSGNIKQFDLDSMAGGSAINRFSQVVLWIVSHPLERSRFHVNYDEDPFKDSNKTIWIMKGRNGKDLSPVEFLFGINGPCFEEVGKKDNEQ